MQTELLPARFSRFPLVPLGVILLGHAIVHFGLGWTLGLSGDEAHYALYAVHLDLSYYDHPPLVGWIQWPLVVLDAPAGILRLIPQALWLATALLIYRIAGRLHGILLAPQPDSAPDAGASSASSAGLWAVLAFSLSPVLHILGIGLLPDTLLMTLTAALVLQTLRMLEPSEVRRPAAWLLLGLLLGLAGLSKYTAIFAALPVLICLLAAHGWRLCLKPWPWLACALAIALVSPVFVWNAQHHWMSFAYQLKHGAGSVWQASQVGVFLVVQLLLYGPLLVLGAVRGVRASPYSLLLVFFALPFAVMTYLSGGGSGLPHWTAPAWVALAPFSGVGLAMACAAGKRRVIAVLLTLQALLCVLVYTLMLTAVLPWGSGPDQLEQINPFADLHGWDRAGQRAQHLARERNLKHLAVQNWTLASRLAWYARPLPVHVLDPAFDMFSLWSGDLAAGESALLMDWTQMSYRLPVGEGAFERCTAVDTVEVQRVGRMVARFTFHHCSNWGGKPAPKRQNEP